MRIVVNKYIPFGTYVAMTVGPFIFVKDIEKVTPVLLTHEQIHWEQQKELLVVFFYILYGLMFLWQLLCCVIDKSRGTRADGIHRSTWSRAYYLIAFEVEAYQHERESKYPEQRQAYAWAKDE